MQARFLVLLCLTLASAHIHGRSVQYTDITLPTSVPTHAPPRGRPNHGPVPGRHRPSARPPTMNSPSKGRPSAHYTPPAMSHPSPPSINLPIDDEDDYDEESAYPTQPPHGPSAYYSTALTAPGSGPSPMYQDDEEMYFESSLKRRMDQEEACPLLSEQRCLVTSDSGEAFECVDTQNAVDSCGGCTEEGEGADCTSIPNVTLASCELGSCQIIACAEGYEISFLGSSCIAQV